MYQSARLANIGVGKLYYTNAWPIARTEMWPAWINYNEQLDEYIRVTVDLTHISLFHNLLK